MADDRYDIDEKLRDELRQDVVEMAAQLGGVTGLLITGDVAFSGSTREYTNAGNWIHLLCVELRIGPENVWMIPGNHDVNREKHTDPLNRVLREKLRTAATGSITAELESIMSVAADRKALLAPLKRYTTFARKYGCAPPKTKDLYWTTNIRLDDQFVLSLRGVNSALVADRTDEVTPDDRKLVLGEVQASIQREPGVIPVVLCHHPERWIRDSDVFQMIYADSYALLTGHEHVSGIQRERHCLRIEAGAVHPERDKEIYEPSYNIVTFELDRDRDELRVCVYERIWNGTRFEQPSAQQLRDCRSLDIDPALIPLASAVVDVEGTPPPFGAPDERYLTDDEIAESPVAQLIDRRLRLRHRFEELRAGEQRVIAATVTSMTLRDIHEAGEELVDEVLDRAEKHQELADLWDRVAIGHNQDPAKIFNPYRAGDGR